ncbi:hypothetical protein JAAARDRAFT_189621 [Jaapia argillacea MUCL 33604]|uniref:Alternative oxidase n=1 Tax=Jaapia argillacea MUCL 33604 TaxID=933084 RepID=A0A067Q5L2_9AGAM|nr:hypothetical protein JAAARDRAFT_189621 [Jaapia argillacea MUCL 33604]
MLRTTLMRAVPAQSLVGPAILLSSRRTFASNASRWSSLVAKRTNEQSVSGSEGPHIRDLPPPPTEGDVFKGDWVLFHPVYSKQELKSVQVVHQETKTFGDKVAYAGVKYTRMLFDLVSGYRHHDKIPENMTLEQLRKKGIVMNEKQWLTRILFLESIAGVPGMVAATCRHLRSLRLMKRDSGWIHTLLEEAENERMHLLTFMTIRDPPMWFRAMILGAQGVYYNLFFFSYLFSPKICHRFVGYLEEEAVKTYTQCINELEAGRLPAWSDAPAPEIAKDYWRLPADAKLIDVMYAVRSDETTHRFVNHSLANLNLKTDVNPFALREPNMHVKGQKIAFEREEAKDYVQESARILEKGRARPQ